MCPSGPVPRQKTFQAVQKQNDSAGERLNLPGKEQSGSWYKPQSGLLIGEMIGSINKLYLKKKKKRFILKTKSVSDEDLSSIFTGSLITRKRLNYRQHIDLHE